jgi:3-keto-5-aminohexanoate cleavage enzyme
VNLEHKPLIISVAPNGAYKTKQDHAEVPITAKEIASTADACLEAGASMIHLHVRNTDGSHSLDPDHYRAAIYAVEQAVGDRLSIQVTSEAAGIYNAEQQIEAIRALAPRSVSIALREIIPTDDSRPAAAEFFLWLSKEKTLPQYILYDANDVVRYRSLVTKGIIPDTPHWLLFVIGRYSEGQQSDPSQLQPFLTASEGIEVPWAVCAFGKTELDCVLAATEQGGHVRVGFENNIFLHDGQIAKGNAELIEQVAKGAAKANHELANADDFRRIFSGWG